VVSKYSWTHIYGTLHAQCASHVRYGIGCADQVAFTSRMMVPNAGRWNQCGRGPPMVSRSRFEQLVLAHRTMRTTWRTGYCKAEMTPRTRSRMRISARSALLTPLLAMIRDPGCWPSCGTSPIPPSMRANSYEM
jgi:hypothetical protein